jgi:hypothetical protein
MNALEGGFTGLSDNADQMNNGVTPFHAAIKPKSVHHISVVKLDTITSRRPGFRRKTHQSADTMSVSHKPREKMPADKAGRTGEENFHGGILKGFLSFDL